MAKVDRLKARARQHEANGEYGQALYLYERALRQLENAEDALPDPMLFVRVADLTYRRGQRDRARDLYVKAAAHFREQGLLNNAVAVWKRVERTFPEELEPLWRLAELHLDLNLAAEAKEHVRELLERMRRAGRSAEAVEVAERFLARSYDEEVESWLRDLQGGSGSVRTGSSGAGAPEGGSEQSGS